MGTFLFSDGLTLLSYGVWVCNCIYRSGECKACAFSSPFPLLTKPTLKSVTRVKHHLPHRTCWLSPNIYPGWPLILYYASLIIHENPSGGAWPHVSRVAVIVNFVLMLTGAVERTACEICNKQPLFLSSMSSKGRKLWTLMCTEA